MAMTPNSPLASMGTYRHPLFGERPATLDEAVVLLRRVTQAFRHVIRAIYDYDDEHPELWASCADHPQGGCGYRDLPEFFLHAVLSNADVCDAEAFLKAFGIEPEED